MLLDNVPDIKEHSFVNTTLEDGDAGNNKSCDESH